MVRASRLDWQECITLHSRAQEDRNKHQSFRSAQQLLANNELKRGVKGEDESAKLFADNQREIEILASTIRANPALVDMERVESLSGVEVLRASLVT